MTLLLNTFPNTQRYLSISMNYYCQLKYHTANIMIEVINAHELPLQIRQNIAMYKISRISFILLVMVMMRRSIFRNGKFQQWHTAQKCHLLKICSRFHQHFRFDLSLAKILDWTTASLLNKSSQKADIYVFMIPIIENCFCFTFSCSVPYNK